MLVIAGPTASGKTALAIALARLLDGEIVSSDSRQIYKRCDIVTAKPTCEEQVLVRHHLLDIADPHQPFSAAQWAQLARQAIAQIQSRGKRVIICGGTGFYIRALLQPHLVAAPMADEELREELERQCDEIGLAAMHARLQVLVPERAATIHANDRYRIVRALEIALSNSSRRDAPCRDAPCRDAPCQDAPTSTCSEPISAIAFRLSWPRAALYARIDGRVDAMIESGAWNELRQLLDSGVPRHAAALSGVGYRQMIPVLDGLMSEAQGVEVWKRESRRYAKRQESWFSNQMEARALEGSLGSEALAEEVAQVLAASLAAASTDSRAQAGGA